ncbi:MAG: hypothetical protein FJX47_04475 [Alphaproteobacteria bacterium]|nr:hypothetical protein [Alphaproteobacteria bacterium]
MRKEKALTTLFTDLVALLADEAARNPAFATRLGQLMAELPERKSAKRKAPKAQAAPPLDLYGELEARGEQEFRHWLRQQSAEALRASVRSHDLDPSHRTHKWKEAEKLADFITDALLTRRARGSAFLGRGSGT